MRTAILLAVMLACSASAADTIGERQVDEARSVLNFPMNALHVPVLVLHGDADPVCPAEEQALPIVEKIRGRGLDVQYEEYPGAGHGLGDHYYDAYDRLLAFFSNKRNIRHPQTIDFTTTSE